MNSIDYAHKARIMSPAKYSAHPTGFAMREVGIYTLLFLTFNPKERFSRGQFGVPVYSDSQWNGDDWQNE